MKNKLIVLLLFIQYYYSFASIIDNDSSNSNSNENTNCSWPCPNQSDICQLSKAGGTMSCQPLQDQQYVI